MTHHYTRREWRSAHEAHKHGRLLPMARPEGELPLLPGALLMFGCLVVATLLLVALGG